ncbi:MAG TPA: LamG domain-containing protein [Aggregatilineales bacterium]|nr:MAG: hypothetical protein HKUEN02_01120 [Anaerolineaceae bacterium]HRE48812.1 LamG domain-containing protein [Aggregatilineales bacterium]
MTTSSVSVSPLAKRALALILAFLFLTPGVPAAAGTYSQKVLDMSPDSLIAYWALTETSGTTALDTSGNGNNGTYTGVVLNGLIGPDGLPAPTFDGLNDSISVPHSTALNPASGITISAWINAQEATYWRGIVAKVNGCCWTQGYGLATLGDGELYGWYGSYGDSLTTQFSIVNQWIHLAYTYDANTNAAALYQNGTLIASGTRSANTLSSENLYIGVLPGGRYWYGAIARVGIWSEALSQSEIAILADPAGLVDATPTPAPPPFTEIITLSGGRQTGVIFSMTAGEILIAALLLFAITLIFFRGVIRR